MADIAMCPREMCNLAKTCKRSAVSGTPRSEPQWWADFGPVGLEECTGWWPVQYEQDEGTERNDTYHDQPPLT